MSRNAEQVLISAIIKTGALSDVLHEGIAPEWFREYANEFAFIMSRYKKTQKVTTELTFKVKYPKFKLLPVDDIDYAIGEMRTWHTKQTLMQLMDDTVQGIESSTDINTLVSDMHRGLVNLTGEVAGSQNESDMVTGWRTNYSAALIRSKKKAAGKSIGIPTGYKTLDALTGGYNPSEFWVHAARLGQGKTWDLVRTAVAAMAAGKTVQFHALEQSRTQLGIRFSPFLARQFGDGQMFKASDIQRGTVDIVGYRKFLSELEKKTGGRLIIDDTPRRKLTSLMLAAKIERNQPDMVIIDYLGLMNSTPGDWAAVAALSADCKELATSYDITVVAANQLNRTAGITRGDAGPEALSGSDAIGQDADGVVTLKSLSKRTKSMFLAKYRHGEDGERWTIHFEPNIGIFDEITDDKAADLQDADRMND